MNLAPLEPNAFLRWLWANNRGALTVGFGYSGFVAPTLDDLAWDVEGWIHWSSSMSITGLWLRKELVHRAARVRKNQRMGLDPFEPYRRYTAPGWRDRSMNRLGRLLLSEWGKANR